MLDLLLLTCPSACGWCYVCRSCSEAPIPQQPNLLNRRLLKILAKLMMNRLEDKLLFEDRVDIEGLKYTGLDFQVGRKRYKLYMPRGQRNEHGVQI